MNGLMIVIEILWIFIWLLLCFEYIDAMQEIPWQAQMISMFIFYIGAPFFLIVNVLETILNLILPEGWDDDDYQGGMRP